MHDHASSAPPADLVRLLARGAFCHLAVRTPSGPHVTPTVFAVSSGRVWVTTARRSVKARAWRLDRHVGGMVRVGERTVCFGGTVVSYDLMDPRTWAASVAAAPALTRAAARFSRKNARFFAGYAADARHVPLAWAPPGRIFVAIELERAAVLDGQRLQRTWGRWPKRSRRARRAAFRTPAAGADPLSKLPPDVAGEIGRAGEAAIAIDGPRGPIVLPVAWTAGSGSVWAALPAHALGLAGPVGERVRTAIEVDRASWWRARHMSGAMIRGMARCYELASLERGLESASRWVRETGRSPAGAALVAIRPDRLVWWRGWQSGTVRLR